MEMIALELRQNVLIAPETRERIGDGADDGMEGFELGDDAECALLEPDDEVLIRLKPAFHLPDLHLPKLSSNHVYALPKGALTRAGTLSSPPPYSQANIKRPAEPSSHSSSVQGQPNVNYNARHRDYTRGYRSITVQSSGQQVQPNQYFGPTPAEARKARGSSNPALNGPSKPLGLGMGVEPPAAQPIATAYKAPRSKPRRSSSHQKDSQQSTTAAASNQTTQTLTSALPIGSPKAAPSPPLPQLPEDTAAAPSTPRTPRTPSEAAGVTDSEPAPPPSAAVASSRPPAVDRKSSTSALNGSSQQQQQSYGSGKPAGQDSMPLTALVIGPGVQGAVGRGSSAAIGHAGPGDSAGGGASSDYGNAKAFASFTAAGGEVRHRSKQRTTSHSSSHDAKLRRETKNGSHARSGSQQDLTASAGGGQVLGSGNGAVREDLTPAQAAVEAAERRAAASRINGNGDTTSTDAGKKDREKTQLPQLPEIPALKDTLPRMPTPADEPSVEMANGRSAEDGGRSVSSGERQGETAVRPANDRHFSSSATSHATSNSASGGDNKKKLSRFARLAAPGLGLGLAPPLSRRQTSQSSVPKASGQSGGDGLGEDLTAADTPSSPVVERSNDMNAHSVPQTPDQEEEPSRTYATATTTADAPAPAPRKLSKAERRFAEYQKQIAQEMSKQAQAEQQRLADKEARRREEEKKAKKREIAAKERKEKEKWEIWEEVRKRTGEEGARQDKV